MSSICVTVDPRWPFWCVLSIGVHTCQRRPGRPRSMLVPDKWHVRSTGIGGVIGGSQSAVRELRASRTDTQCIALLGTGHKLRGGGGGATKREGGGGTSEVLPLKKRGGGGRKLSRHAEGGAQQFWSCFNTGAWSYSDSGGGGAQKRLTLSWGGGVCVVHTLPIINGIPLWQCAFWKVRQINRRLGLSRWTTEQCVT